MSDLNFIENFKKVEMKEFLHNLDQIKLENKQKLVEYIVKIYPEYSDLADQDLSKIMFIGHIKRPS